MNIVKKVISESLRKKEKELNKIDDLINRNLIGEICELRLQAQEIIKENNGNHEEIARLIKPLGIKEKKLFDIAKKQSNPKLFEKKLALSMEISELKSELSKLDFYKKNLL